MEEEVVNTDDSYSDDDDEEEELDPRIQDELEKLNAATNSINHLEAELDEARAVFRQTLAGATSHLNAIAQKLGKCVDKSRPFYESYRQLRQSHGMLQKSTNQFERATGMHVAARTRVLEAERRVFGGGPKRAFDTALQEMLNQATIEVNEAEKLKRDSWKKHQEDLKAYRDLEAKVKKLYKKLKSSVEKAKPYFEQKREFDRHLWQLKIRVDSILVGLSSAKENYSACLRSLEIISDDIHEKRKCKRMESMLSKIQRESGVGADSSTEEETSLHASNLDLDFDSSLNFEKLDGLSDDFHGSDGSVNVSESCSKEGPSAALDSVTRVVYGLESSDNGKDPQSIATANKDDKEELHSDNSKDLQSVATANKEDKEELHSDNSKDLQSVANANKEEKQELHSDNSKDLQSVAIANKEEKQEESGTDNVQGTIEKQKETKASVNENKALLFSENNTDVCENPPEDQRLAIEQPHCSDLDTFGKLNISEKEMVPPVSEETL